MNSLSPSTYGLKGNGQEEDPQAIDKMFAASDSQGIPIVLPQGSHYITNKWHNIAGRTSMICPTRDATWETTADGDGNMFFALVGTNGASFDGFTLKAPSNNTVGFTARNTLSASLTNIKTAGCALFLSNEIGYNPSWQPKDLCQGIYINYCDVVGSMDGWSVAQAGQPGQLNGNALIGLRYVLGAKVLNTKLQKGSHGIVAWGADSDPSAQGRKGAAMFATNIEIGNVYGTNFGGAGIMASMGENFHVHDCYVQNCADVGLDYEGCRNSLAERNGAFNCTNGAITAFFLSDNVTFRNNIGRQPHSNMWSFAIYNGGQSAQGTYDSSQIGTITLQSNTFDTGMVGQGNYGKIITDGNNKFINGATSNWNNGKDQLPGEQSGKGTGAAGTPGNIVPIGVQPIAPAVPPVPVINTSAIQEDINLMAGLAIKTQNDLNAILKQQKS